MSKCDLRPLPTFAVCVALLLFVYFGTNSAPFPTTRRTRLTTSGRLPCTDLPGANETVIVLKTGSTEIEAKLPVHLSTTLRCYPHRLIFSDTSDRLKGEKIIDALESVSSGVKEGNSDFELYRRLRSEGRKGLKLDELHGEAQSVSATGHVDNPGWRLDKWKFLPTVNRTFHEFPNMKWYVFVEADTYILWGSLLAHLATMDPSLPWYLGSRVFIGDVAFAHGGSGFIVSQPAMRLVVDYYTAHQQEIEAFTDGHWAGDCVLGKSFADAGVPLTEAWPVLQGDYPGKLAYVAPDGRTLRASDEQAYWCKPTVSFHQMQPDMIKDLWCWEQRRHTMHKSERVLHRDVFVDYVLPRMRVPRQNWDNESGDGTDSEVVVQVPSLESCMEMCKANAGCVQYSFDERDRGCRRFDLPRLGKKMPGMRSGWLVERIEQKATHLGPCE